MTDQLDPARWTRLLDAYHDAQDEGPPFIQVQAAQGALTQARSDLERHRARGRADQKGHADRHNSYKDLDEAHARDLAELERRVAEREREVNRLNAKAAACSKRRGELRQLVDAIRHWAQAEGIVLPGDHVERPAVVAMRGASPNAPEFLRG